jgi:gliding motility-associated-like protein
MGPTACAVNEQLTITVLPTDGNLITQDSEICEGETIDLESNGAGTYSWTPNDGTLSSTTASSTTASPLNTTTYFVLFNAGQCESLDSVNVVVNLNPVVEINNGQASFDICDGESLNLTGNNFANGQYTWEDNQGNVVSNVDSYNADASGIYTLLVLDDNNCSGEASVEIFVRITPDMDYTNLRTILCCIGDEVALNPLDYLLNAANVAEVIVNGAFVQGSVLEESGMNSTYIIEVFTNEACTSLDTVEFSTNCINPEIVAADSVFLGGSTPVNVNFTDNGGITVINWLEGSLFENSTVASTNLLANQSEEFYNYSVSVEETFVLNNPDSSLTCVETVEDIIYTINVNDPLIPDAFSPNGDNVNQLFFPVNLDINSTLVALRVFDRWGNEVYNYQAGGLGWDGTYEGVNQPVDVYSYYIKIEKPSGDFIKSGSLTLIR